MSVAVHSALRPAARYQKFTTNQKLFDRRRMNTGLGRAAGNTNIHQDQTAKMQTCFIMLQKCSRSLTKHCVSLLFLFRQVGVDPGLTTLLFRRRRKWDDNIKRF